MSDLTLYVDIPVEDGVDDVPDDGVVVAELVHVEAEALALGRGDAAVAGHAVEAAAAHRHEAGRGVARDWEVFKRKSDIACECNRSMQ